MFGQSLCYAAGTVGVTGFEGRVSHRGQVLPGVRVYTYDGFESMLANNPSSTSPATGDDGGFVMAVPPGEYILVAKRLASGPGDGPLFTGDLYSFHGSNPVSVTGETLTHVGFSMVEYKGTPEYVDTGEAGVGAISGTVTYMGEPLEGAHVSIYIDPKDGLKGMGYSFAPPTGPTGRFIFDFLPESEYYIVVRKRLSGKSAGPITDGDYFGYYPGNPLRVKSGKKAVIELEAVSKASEIGKDDSMFRVTGTSITGRIKGADGKPVEGVYAFAYTDKLMMHKRPEYISRETGPDGVYVLNLAEGGTYYVGARSDYGDSPGIGEWYGKYDETADHSVVIESGARLEGIDVIVEQVLLQ
jgi:hypothetical protein